MFTAQPGRGMRSLQRGREGAPELPPPRQMLPALENRKIHPPVNAMSYT